MVWAFKQYAILSLAPLADAIVGLRRHLGLHRQENALSLCYKFPFAGLPTRRGQWA